MRNMWWAEWHWVKFFSDYCGFFFSQSLSLHLCPIPAHRHVVVTRTKGEDWELYKKHCSSKIGEHSIEKFLRTFFLVFWRLIEIPVTRQTASTRVYLNFYPWLETRVGKLSRSMLQYKTIEQWVARWPTIKQGNYYLRSHYIWRGLWLGIAEETW